MNGRESQQKSLELFCNNCCSEHCVSFSTNVKHVAPCLNCSAVQISPLFILPPALSSGKKQVLIRSNEEEKRLVQLFYCSMRTTPESRKACCSRKKTCSTFAEISCVVVASLFRGGAAGARRERCHLHSKNKSGGHEKNMQFSSFFSGTKKG